MAKTAELGARVVELAGILVILIAVAVSTARFLVGLHRLPFRSAYKRYRRHLGHGILLGLEFLVAADIIGTVLLESSLRNLAVLAALVLIRTFLSFTLTVEVDGRWPWQTETAPTEHE